MKSLNQQQTIVRKVTASDHSYAKFASIVLATTLASFAISMQASAQSMSKADYEAAKTRISSEYKSDKAICKQLAGNAKDICNEEGQAKEKIAKAELTYSYTAKHLTE